MVASHHVIVMHIPRFPCFLYHNHASGISFTKTFCHQKKLNQCLANGFYVVNDYFFCRRIGDNYLYLSSWFKLWSIYLFPVLYPSHMRQLPLIHVEHDLVHWHYSGKDLTNFVFVKDLVFTSDGKVLCLELWYFFISFIKVPEKIHF